MSENPGNKRKRILQFWDSRADLGDLAGTNDFMLTRIEQDFIESIVPENSRVLDVGCGNSSTLIKLAKYLNCHGVGIDFSNEMVQTSLRFVKENKLEDKILNYQNEVPPVPTQYGVFDVVLSNRSIINLDTTKEQEKAVRSVEHVLKPGGMYLMIECSQDGADYTNDIRKKLNLEPIEAPWHNLFLKEDEVKSWQSDSFKIEKLLHISSTYNFISRIIYAKLADLTGETLKYDSELNKISSMLPQEFDQFGPVKAWLWSKVC